jgi:hypothetical protein
MCFGNYFFYILSGFLIGNIVLKENDYLIELFHNSKKQNVNDTN